MCGRLCRFTDRLCSIFLGCRTDFRSFGILLLRFGVLLRFGTRLLLCCRFLLSEFLVFLILFVLIAIERVEDRTTDKRNLDKGRSYGMILHEPRICLGVLIDLMNLFAHKARKLGNGLECFAPSKDSILDLVLVVANRFNQRFKAVIDLGHEFLGGGKQSRTEGKFQLPRFHLHFAPFEVCLMCLFRVEQSRGLDTRRNGHQIVILFEDRNKSRTTRSKHLGGIRFLHSRFACCLVSLGKLRQLLIERQEIALLIFERNTKAREGACGIVTRISGGRYLLVETCNQRNDALDIRIRKLKHPIECCRLTRGHMKSLCELIDILTRKHRIFRDIEQPRTRRSDCHNRSHLCRQHIEPAR